MHILHICNALLLTQDNVKSKADQMNIWYGAVHILDTVESTRIEPFLGENRVILD